MPVLLEGGDCAAFDLSGATVRPCDEGEDEGEYVINYDGSEGDIRALVIQVDVDF